MSRFVDKVKSLLAFYKEGVVEAGCDEAGRGCLAGPVHAAAVILPKDYSNPLLDDSKKLTHKKRLELREEIERDSIAWAVGVVDHKMVDRVNVLNAAILAMHSALNQLDVKPQHIIVDGNRFKKFGKIPHQCIVKGDGIYASIAAASILAKTYRDEFMANLHEEYPVYDWKKNKGYPTKFHREAIDRFGVSPYHRQSFNLNRQLKFDFE